MNEKYVGMPCDICGKPIMSPVAVEYDGCYYCRKCSDDAEFELGDGHHIVFLQCSM